VASVVPSNRLCGYRTQFVGGRLLLSASDLVNFLGCRHAPYLAAGTAPGSLDEVLT
jgi:hypothetical protein